MERTNTHEDKILVTARLKSPIEIYSALVFFILALGIVAKEMLLHNSYETDERVFLVLLILASFYFVIYMGKRQYKNLVIYSDKIIVKPLFSFNPIVLDKEQVRGFELFETYVRGGLGYNLRLITVSNKLIVFPRDNYANYDQMITAFHKSAFPYLGQQEYNHRYKNAYLAMLKWAAIILPFAYGLLMLLKGMKR